MFYPFFVVYLISRILYLFRVSVIYLVLPTPNGFCLRKINRADFKPKYMWHCNLQGLSHRQITLPTRALLPHVFTLTQ